MPARRLSPSRSLQKLRTAFSQSPTRLTNTNTNSTPLSPTTSTSSTTSSPTPTDQPSFAGFAGFSFSATTSPTLSAPEEFQFPEPDSRRVIRRKKSCVEIEQEQERWQFDGALVGLVEPRPRVGPALGGIEEVLCGEV